MHALALRLRRGGRESRGGHVPACAIPIESELAWATSTSQGTLPVHYMNREIWRVHEDSPPELLSLLQPLWLDPGEAQTIVTDVKRVRADAR